jgi:hypothetical protein
LFIAISMCAQVPSLRLSRAVNGGAMPGLLQTSTPVATTRSKSSGWITSRATAPVSSSGLYPRSRSIEGLT